MLYGKCLIVNEAIQTHQIFCQVATGKTQQGLVCHYLPPRSFGSSFYHFCLHSKNIFLFLLFTPLDTTAPSQHLTVTKLEKQPCLPECHCAGTTSFCKQNDLTSYVSDPKAIKVCRDESLFPFNDIPWNKTPSICLSQEMSQEMHLSVMK